MEWMLTYQLPACQATSLVRHHLGDMAGRGDDVVGARVGRDRLEVLDPAGVGALDVVDDHRVDPRALGQPVGDVVVAVRRLVAGVVQPVARRDEPAGQGARALDRGGRRGDEAEPGSRGLVRCAARLGGQHHAAARRRWSGSRRCAAQSRRRRRRTPRSVRPWCPGTPPPRRTSRPGSPAARRRSACGPRRRGGLRRPGCWPCRRCVRRPPRRARGRPRRRPSPASPPAPSRPTCGRWPGRPRRRALAVRPRAGRRRCR